MKKTNTRAFYHTKMKKLVPPMIGHIHLSMLFVIIW